MIENLSKDQLAGILEAIPVEITFVLEATQDITEIKNIEGEKRL